MLILSVNISTMSHELQYVFLRARVTDDKARLLQVKLNIRDLSIF